MIYLILGVVGTIGTWYFALQRGLNDPTFLTDTLANTAAASQAADLFVCSALVLVFILAEGKRVGIRHLWRFVLLLFVFAVSGALGWFLYERERRLASQGPVRV